MATTSQDTIHQLFNSKVVNVQLLESFNLYHSSVTQKLWSVAYYNQNLYDLDINQFRTPTATLLSGATYTFPPMDPVIEYCRHLNLLIDGYFMNSMSVLDTLAHEIFVLYSSSGPPSNIYIDTAHKMIRESHSTCLLKNVLDSELNPSGWFTEFERYRHCTTHESLIPYDSIHFTIDPINFTYRLSQPIKLPDNPQVRPLTYNLNRNVIDYSQQTLQKLQSFVSGIYDSALVDIHANGDTVPIP
jgi:hypothetical protein